MPFLSSYFDTSRAYLIGVQNYDIIKSLSTPIQDVDDIGKCLLNHDFDKENILQIKDATKREIETTLKRMQDEIGYKDRVLFYFAGHGIAHDSGDEPKGFLIPKDGSRNDEKTFIDMKWLSQKFSRLRCKHFLLILDCCFSGSFKWADNYRDSGLDQTKKIYLEKFERFVSAETEAWQVITSSAYDEEAIDNLLNLGDRDSKISNKNSPFAEIFLSALNGLNNNYFEDGIITATRLYNYIDTKFAQYIADNNIKKKQLPNYFPLQRNKKGQFIFLVPQLGDLAINKLPKLENKNPYKGLSSFESKDSHLFFGRKNAVKNLVTLFKATNSNEIVLISGSSGIGKSSLIMAGLIPELLSDYPGSSKINPIRPGNIKNKSKYVNACEKEIEAVTNSFILFIDQFEEMITICSQAERLVWETFIVKNLLRTDCRVIVSMRSDFESQLSEVSIIKNGLKNRFVVPPFERNEIKDIIVQPALQSLIEIKANSKDDTDASQFIDRICDEAMQSLGSLPLLSFALEQWYELNLEKEVNTFELKEEYYNGIGGVSGALGTIVNGFMNTVQNQQEEDNLKRLMLRMVTVQDENFARAKVYDYELDSYHPESNIRSQRQLLEELIKLRIITTNRKSSSTIDNQEQVYYEPAHDAVLTSWKKLWDWLNIERVNIPTFQQLSEDTQRWKTSNFKNSLLWVNGVNLSIVRNNYEDQSNTKSKTANFKEGFISTITYGYRPKIKEKQNLFNLEERKFISKSLYKVRQNKARLNILYFLIVIAGIVAIIFGINANFQKKEALSQAKKNFANLLANNSDNQEPVTAFYSLRQADSLNPNSSNILQRAFNLFEAARISFNFLPENIIPLKNELYNLSFVNNKDLLLITNSNNYFRVDLKTGKIIDSKKQSGLNFQEQPSGFVNKINYSPEGGIISFNKCDAEVTEIIASELKQDAKFLMISPNHIRLGKFLGINSIINRDTCITAALNFSQDITSGCFIKDSSSIIIICSDNSIFLADFKNNKVFQLIKGYRMDQLSHFYTISDDQTKFAAVNSSKLIYVWNLESPNLFSDLKRNRTDEIFKDDLKISESGKLGEDNIIRYEMKKNDRTIKIALPSKPDDYSLLVARNPEYSEFIVYQKVPNKYHVINDNNITPLIELPNKQNIDRAVFINYSINSEKIFYTVYTDEILSNAFSQNNSKFPDSVIAQFPSLKKIKSWIHNSPAILSDTIP